MDYFRGKWIIHYDTGTYTYPTILNYLIDINQYLKKNRLSFNLHKINFSPLFSHNSIIVNENKNNPDYSQIKFNIIDNKFSSTSIKYLSRPDHASKFKLLKNKIKKLKFLLVFNKSDKRWETLDFTPAALFIGSSLISRNFDFSVEKISTSLKFEDNSTALGLTLFEDLFLEYTSLFNDLSPHHEGIICSGGPFITLAPLKTIYHLPRINLFIRGEAELILPEILTDLNNNNMHKLLKHRGFFFQHKGQIIISDLQHINRLQDFSLLKFNFEFLRDFQLKNGLEINLTRGCSRQCIFCCKIQGDKQRKPSLNTVSKLLHKYNTRILNLNQKNLKLRAININDDDILQDPDYAGKLFSLLKKKDFKLWGIQSSLSSFFLPGGKINSELINLIKDRDLYVNNNPLLWLGTDSFLKIRSKRLRKFIPSAYSLRKFILKLEQAGINNYHYWICSDQSTSWEEFLEEFIFIYRLKMEYQKFYLLAHSPFLIPYPSTPLYKHSKLKKHQIKYKTVLKTEKDIFSLRLVDKLQTLHPNLNRLLENESVIDNKGFFHYLHRSDFKNTFLTLYYFLKRERIMAESVFDNIGEKKSLKKLEAMISDILSDLS